MKYQYFLALTCCCNYTSHFAYCCSEKRFEYAPSFIRFEKLYTTPGFINSQMLCYLFFCFFYLSSFISNCKACIDVSQWLQFSHLVVPMLDSHSTKRTKMTLSIDHWNHFSTLSMVPQALFQRLAKVIAHTRTHTHRPVVPFELLTHRQCRCGHGERNRTHLWSSQFWRW